ARAVDARLLLLLEPANPMQEMLAEAARRQIPAEVLLIRSDLDPTVSLRLRGRLRAWQPDIVHTHLIHADLFGLAAAKLAGVKVILSGRHNDDSFRYHPAVRALNRLLWRGFSGGIAISDALRQFTTGIEGAPAHKVRVVTYGFEYTPPPPADLAQARADLLGRHSLPPEALLVGLACRLVEQKGVTYALRAFSQVAADFPAAHLLIAGDGELRPLLAAEATALRLAERVHFLGWQDDVPRLLAGLDVFLMPSLWEGFGLVLLEAMSKRLPVIASAVSAIPEVVEHGVTGLLVPPADPDALAQALRVLLPDRSLRAYLGLNGEDRLDRLFSAARMAEETIAVYEDFLTRTRP
nr:glycosyltransferase [Anaerolineae bacterium]